METIKEEKKAELEEENRNLKSDLEQFSEAYKRYRDFEKEELAESCYDLAKENKKLREENEMLRCSKGGTPEKVGHEEMIQYLMEENKKLKEENEVLEEYKSMYEGLLD